MSVVIIGGNECMERHYTDLCKEYNCRAKVFYHMKREMQNFGTPDLLVLFTGTVSHKMVKCALSKTDSKRTRIARSHSSSLAALRSIMESHFG